MLANDYFDQTEAIAAEGNAAALYFFEHRFGDDADARAWPAGSTRSRCATTRSASRGPARRTPTRPWAAASPIRPEAYAAVRGFPRKNAAEDFYVLDKLAKVGSIVAPGRDRRSCSKDASPTASPSGPGKALSDLIAKKKALSGFRLYHPAVFAHLAAWLRVLDAIAASGGRMEVALDELPRDNPFFLTDSLLEALEKMKAIPAMREAIERSGDAATMRRHFHTWFDAFRTLKLIHALRDAGLPSLPWRAGPRGGALHRARAPRREEEAEPLRRALAAEERKLAETPRAGGRPGRALVRPEQEPGPRGSPQDPQPPAGPSTAGLVPPPAPTAKTESSFSQLPALAGRASRLRVARGRTPRSASRSRGTDTRRAACARFYRSARPASRTDTRSTESTRPFSFVEPAGQLARRRVAGRAVGVDRRRDLERDRPQLERAARTRAAAGRSASCSAGRRRSTGAIPSCPRSPRWMSPGVAQTCARS